MVNVTIYSSTMDPIWVISALNLKSELIICAKAKIKVGIRRESQFMDDDQSVGIKARVIVKQTLFINHVYIYICIYGHFFDGQPPYFIVKKRFVGPLTCFVYPVTVCWTLLDHH